MEYRSELIIPASTPKSTPVEDVLKVVRGDIIELRIFFPAGQAGLTYVQLYHGQAQVYPTTPGLAFRGDDSHIILKDKYTLEEKPFAIRVLGYAPSSTLDHTVFVGLTMSIKQKQGLVLEVPLTFPIGFLPSEG